MQVGPNPTGDDQKTHAGTVGAAISARMERLPAWPSSERRRDVRAQQTAGCMWLRRVVDPLAPREPLTSERDASQGVRVSQVVGSLQKTTQHGWKQGKSWPMLENVFHGPTP